MPVLGCKSMYAVAFQSDESDSLIILMHTAWLHPAEPSTAKRIAMTQYQQASKEVGRE